MRNRCFNCGCKFDAVRSDQMFCSKSCRYKYNHRGEMVLTLKKQWFDMILSGVKTEEYREIKPYWETRFGRYFGRHYDFSEEYDINQGPPPIVWNKQTQFIVFRNGYGTDKPEFTAECSIREDYGKEEWGAEPNTKYYVLTIHRVFDVKNLKN